MLQTVKHLLWFCKGLFVRFREHNGVSSAAALTYTTLFAVVPLMTVTFSVLSAIPFFHGMGGQIQTFIFSNFVPSTGATVQEYLQGFSIQARHLTWVGILALAVTAYLMLLNIEQAFNVIWHVRHSRRGVSSFLLYWAILSLGPLLLGAGFAISTYVASFTLLSGPHPLPGAATLLRVLPLVCSIAAFTLIYATVPNTRVPMKHALAGGVFAAVLFEAAKQLFSIYVGLFPSYELIYGSATVFAVGLSVLANHFVWCGTGLQSVHPPAEKTTRVTPVIEFARGFAGHVSAPAIWSGFQPGFSRPGGLAAERTGMAGDPAGA